MVDQGRQWRPEQFGLRALELADELVAIRRRLHEHPELSFQEAETAAFVAERLEGLGWRVRMGVGGGHGVIAELEGRSGGRLIALRADMDALPIQEETGLSFSSARPGVMHACGHDAHTAMLLGAAQLLAEAHAEQALHGTVRLLFQCAEEVGLGAQVLIDHGALDGVDEIYGLHNLPTLPAGRVGVRPGPMMGSSDLIAIDIEGKGGHGAVPDQCVDPIVAGTAVVSALQTIASREVSPFEPVVVTIGSFHAGSVGNIVPGSAELQGTVRTFSPAVRGRLPARLQLLVADVAAAHRCKGTLRYMERTPVLINDEACTAAFADLASAILGTEQVVRGEATMIGEDFARYLELVPGCFFWLGSGPEQGAEQAYGLHHPKLQINESCLPIGASLLASVAFERVCKEV
ncbi:M20 metallopeptidase family protein [Paenibacillus koleovorans]|uniref:M20 metallopeptidase family protein n=1 Tax=Paenibacillus koleovorans TaxID=121608 RepID=UPI000FDB5E23|nr:amidohydrolase [Paenibacillus koleovorans]